MALIDPKCHYLVVAHDFCHELYADEVEAIAAAFRAADEGLPCRVLLIVREIDVEQEWERCPSCSRPVHGATGCWWKPCVEARAKSGDDLR